ncbi:MAG: hypothetical protein IKW30_03750 [Lachnospiraceae bacterium]|nr:hypothetical protein [Lachnospiraceae bacterium]
MLEMDGKRVYPLANEGGNIQGTMEATKSLIEGNSRVEIRIVGQIRECDEKTMAEEIEKLVKKFCS